MESTHDKKTSKHKFTKLTVQQFKNEQYFYGTWNNLAIHGEKYIIGCWNIKYKNIKIN